MAEGAAAGAGGVPATTGGATAPSGLKLAGDVKFTKEGDFNSDNAAATRFVDAAAPMGFVAASLRQHFPHATFAHFLGRAASFNQRICKLSYALDLMSLPHSQL
jgi:hypothetical protein